MASKKRSSNLKERVAIRNVYRVQEKCERETHDELESMHDFLKSTGNFEFASQQIQCSLTFKQVAGDFKNPFLTLSKEKGKKISRRLSSFLRHDLPEGQFSKIDGSMEVGFVQKCLGISKEEILCVTHPIFGEDDGPGERLGKRRFVVLELFHPDFSRTTRIAALGGHSKEVLAPPGHYQLGIESISQISPLTHNTSAVEAITQSGYLSQQKRLGGINFSSGKNSYRHKATHKIQVNAELALSKGYVFLGNRFSNVCFGMGKWFGGAWTGKIPLEYLDMSTHE